MVQVVVAIVPLIGWQSVRLLALLLMLDLLLLLQLLLLLLHLLLWTRLV